ncbi:protein of unknown function [Methylorubrum extorquens DM4]|uniref:Uncharacterized protein n=1 Tax=Methylorubrum extorquens (strain DSM 6343 / CIP 106787 / DM4) TaxID=661410 RepID=C7CC96_METED|nr:protein of unknown function [Methylorubrum extorquens DM4]
MPQARPAGDALTSVAPFDLAPVCLRITDCVRDAWRSNRPTYRGGRLFVVIRARVAALLDHGHASLRLTTAHRRFLFPLPLI